MDDKLRFCVLIFVSFTGCVHSNITITSSPQLGVDTVCDNQDVTLMCHTDQTTGNMITWYWSNQSQHGDTIAVVARMTGVVYTCMVSEKDARQLENASVIVVANGSPPHVDEYNFNPYILKYERSNLTLITKISSDLSLSNGYPIWIIDFRLPLPSTAVVDNYITDGVLYSRLSLYELSFEDDTGNYTNIVSNQCGTSSVSVYIDVRKAPIVCNNSGSVAVPQKNIMTVKGEYIVLHCLFKGNLKILWLSMSSYWVIGSHNQHTEPTYIMDNSTDPYRIAVYQTCLSKDGSCCNFTNQLSIKKISLGLHNTVLTCGEVLDEVTNAHSASLMVFDTPTVAKTSKRNIKAHINDSKTLQCQFNAPTMKDVTVIVWTKDDMAINSSDHYRIRTFTKPGIDDLIVSEITINNIAASDQGKYSCYCYYNRDLVTSSKPVVSEQQSFRIYFKSRNDFPFDYAAVGIAVASLLMLVLSSMLALYICRHRLYNGTPEEKGLVEGEEDTGGTGHYGINGVKSGVVMNERLQEVNNANRGVASTGTSNNSGPMRSVLDHNQFSSNFYSSCATGIMYNPPISERQESDSEDDDVNRPLLISHMDKEEPRKPLLQSNPTPCTGSVLIQSNRTKDCQVFSTVCATDHCLPHPTTVSHTFDSLKDLETQEDSDGDSRVQQLQIKAEMSMCGVTDKVALLIGNSNYQGQLLKCPHNNVTAMTEKLMQLNFKTISLVDLTLNEMSRAVKYFCDHLGSGMYGLFYYSGHGLEVQNTLHLMPINANDKLMKIEEWVNYDVILQRMQKQSSTIISILDCCKKTMEYTAICNQSLPSNTQHGRFSNVYEIFACAVSFEAFEMKGSKLSFCTQALLHVLDLQGKKLKQDISQSIKDYYIVTTAMGRPFARPRVIDQLTRDISLDDPVHVLSDNKDILLELPERVKLDFNHPTMKTTYGHILLEFEAEFSNVLIVHVTCDVRLQPELNVKEIENLGLAAQLRCDVKREENIQVISYRISNLLTLKDVIQNSGLPAQLRFSCQMPSNSAVKDIIVYRLSTTLINPTF